MTRWNRDKERWDRLWRETKVAAAPIPKALSWVFSPLRLERGAPSKLLG